MIESFKVTLRRRSILGLCYCGLVCLLLLLFWKDSFMVNGHISAYTLGEATGIAFVAAFYSLRGLFALRDESRLKKLYIAETDERSLFIAAKSGGAAMTVAMAGLALGALCAGFFSEAVFWALNGAMLFLALVCCCFKLYYRRAV
ncbi:MAG: hypothetical protein LBU47_06740 [Christensenellaceae bacterium]|jgi:hypothetical protein|nr:hypothetical protein [Christensenellaceae bacterium]